MLNPTLTSSRVRLLLRGGRRSAAGEGYVVSIRSTGLGDRLAALSAAWRFARITGRTLVVDWRFGRMARDPMENAFARYFEPADTLAGVRFVADTHFPPARLPKPRYPAIWNADALLELPFLRRRRGFAAGQRRAVRLIRSGRDLGAGTVVFDGCINDGIVDLDEARSFYSALTPTPSIAKEVAAFKREKMGDRPAIAVHIRHGNGGNIMGHRRYWDSFDTAMDRCLRAVDHARARLGPRSVVFLATDSSEVEQAFKSKVGDALTRPKHFPPPGTGELHRRADAWLSATDTAVEMLLLAACDAVVRYPPASFFSLCAAVTVAPKGGNLNTIYDLLRPWDGSALSPAVILARDG